MVSLVGYPVARRDHQRRSQEDRYHVYGARDHHAAARLFRRADDARAAGGRLRAEPGLFARRSLRPDLHRARRDHDLLRGDAAHHGADELYRPLADRSEEHTSELQSLVRISYAV